MTAPQPRRTRRRSVPAASLPRPVAVEGVDRESGEPKAASASPRPVRRGPTARPHHVTNDYRYVRTDLLLVAGVGAVAVAFVVGMSFVI
ncbi:MAG: hypothetical protein ACKVT1_20665 [Dehalococcoidia bacterium]